MKKSPYGFSSGRFLVGTDLCEVGGVDNVLDQ